MRTGIAVELTAADRAQLEVIAADPQQSAEARLARPDRACHSPRALAPSRSCATRPRARRPCGTGRSVSCGRVSKACSATGPRPSRIRPLGPEVTEYVVAADPCRTAGRDDPLDRPSDGKAAGIGQSSRPAYLVCARARAAPHPHLQAVQRPGVRGQGPRHRRALCRSAGTCRRTLVRREEPDPGARPNRQRATLLEKPIRPIVPPRERQIRYVLAQECEEPPSIAVVPACQRWSILKREGVVPVSLRKLSVKWLWLAKPTASATSAIDRLAPSSISLPRRMRRSIR